MSSLGKCAESGKDFTALTDLAANPFTIAVGERTNTFTITTTDDRDEWDQDIVLELSVEGITDANATVSSSEAGGPPKYMLTITDSDDDPFINFQSDASTFETTTKGVTEGNILSTKVYLSRISEKTITIGYSIESAEADFGIFTAEPSNGTGAVECLKIMQA